VLRLSHSLSSTKENILKACSICGESKQLSEFNKNSAKRDGLQSKCRMCQRLWYNGYYNRSEREKQRILANNKKVREFSRDLIRTKKDIPCADCGVKYPYWVMQFDHLYDKSFNIATALHRRISVLEDEIAKCEVVCANCHADRTYRRINDSTSI
jgi:hypothetical protein